MKELFNFIFQKKIILPIIIAIVGFLVYKIIKYIVHKILNKGKTTYEQKKRLTIVELTTNIIKGFIATIVIIMILDIYGVDTASLVASLGIVGVVLGFALQETAQDLIKGIFIITDNYYVIGDIVTINNFTGEVIELSLKTTKIKNLAGEVLVLPNHSVSSITNLSQSRAGIKIEVPTAYEETSEKVENTLKKVVEQAKKMPHVYADSKYLGIEAFDNSSITYGIIIYCKQGEQWDIKRQLLKMIKLAYEKDNIKIPYSQIEVHNGKKIV